MFDETKAESVILGIANGKLLSDIAGELGVDRTTIWRWQQQDADFATQCARAREFSADMSEEEISRLMGEVRRKDVEPDAARVILNGLTWLAKVRAPKVYGERTSHEHTGGDGGPIEFRVGVRFVGGAAGSLSVPVAEES